jgi:hypothetical protein
LTETLRTGPVGAEGPFRYRAFGLSIASDLQLAELEAGDGSSPDLTIRLVGEVQPDDDSPPSHFAFSDDMQFLSWKAVGSFRIVGTSLVEIARAPGVSDELLHFPLLGPVFALLLHLRGFMVLHASAVALGDGSAVFLGDKMAGKSTTAAAFVAAGGRLLTDDVLAIAFPENGDPVICPGFAQLKLDDGASREVIGKHAVRLPLVMPDFPKQQHRLTTGFSLTEVRPSRFYVLERGERAHVSSLPPQDALVALMRYSYAARFSSRVLSGEAGARHFRQCAVLAGHPGVSRLEVPTGLRRIEEIVRLVEQDIGQQALGMAPSP